MENDFQNILNRAPSIHDKIAENVNDLEVDTNPPSRISKVRGVFASLNSIWKSSNISLKTEVRIFRSNVLSVLLYGAES